VEGVFGVGDTLACGRVVIVDLEDVGTTGQKSVEVGGSWGREGEGGGGREDEVCGVGGEEGAGEGVTDRGRFVSGDDVGH
jgi:hypothetical protein